VDASGHRLLPHTADVMVEAWGPDRSVCLREAVRGLVEAFADVGGVVPTGTVPVAFGPDGGEELLLDVLDEVLYLLDAEDLVPVDASFVDRPDGGLEGVFVVASSAAVSQHGAVPKAIARHALVLQEEADWRCRVTVDV
jgi:SHS2 domain-containing protein